jgi:hypothetical protein
VKYAEAIIQVDESNANEETQFAALFSSDDFQLLVVLVLVQIIL